MVARDHADTAMLLRELSSLGFGADDDLGTPAPDGASAQPAGRPEEEAQGTLRPRLIRAATTVTAPRPVRGPPPLRGCEVATAPHLW